MQTKELNSVSKWTRAVTSVLTRYRWGARKRHQCGHGELPSEIWSPISEAGVRDLTPIAPLRAAYGLSIKSRFTQNDSWWCTCALNNLLSPRAHFRLLVSLLPPV